MIIAVLRAGPAIFAGLGENYLDGLFEQDQHEDLGLVYFAELEHLVGMVPEILVFLEQAPHLVGLLGLNRCMLTCAVLFLIAYVSSSSSCALSSPKGLFWSVR